MTVILVDDVEPRSGREPSEAASALAGSQSSSLQKVKDNGRGDSAFFVFGDLSVKLEGIFKLKFSLYESRADDVEFLTDVISAPFQVYSAKTWPGMGESTAMTRALADQGIRLRLRKEPRFRLQPQGPASDHYEPRKYTPRRSESGHEYDVAMNVGRRKSMSQSTPMMPTPQEQKESDSEQQSTDQQEEEMQQQQYMMQNSMHSPPTPVAPQPIQPIPSFISAESRKRERERSMSSHQGSPAPGSSAFQQPLLKRSRPVEDQTQPAMYGEYPTPQSVRTGQNYQAFQMYPPGQLEPPPHLGRPPTYSHGAPNLMAGARAGQVYDLAAEQRETASMSPFRNPSIAMDVQFQQRPQSNLSMGYGQFGNNSMLTAPFSAGMPSISGVEAQQQAQQQMMQQRMGFRQSLPNHLTGMPEQQRFEYESTPDPTLDPLLAAQSQQRPRSSMMPLGNMMSNNMDGPGQFQPPQYYGRQMPGPDEMMNAAQQNDMAAQNNFFLNAGQDMRAMGTPPDGVGFRSQDGVGFREAYVGNAGNEDTGLEDIGGHGHQN